MVASAEIGHRALRLDRHDASAQILDGADWAVVAHHELARVALCHAVLVIVGDGAQILEAGIADRHAKVAGDSAAMSISPAASARSTVALGPKWTCSTV